MRTLSIIRKISEAEYLALEEDAEIRHEYVDGMLFAMTGGTKAHALIATNITSHIHAHLGGSGCHVYSNNVKVKIETATISRFYYPDIMVSCAPFHPLDVIEEKPVFIAEVLSRGTKQIDRREKLVAYQRIESLKEYLIIYQDRQQMELYSRISEVEWQLAVLKPGDEVQLNSLPNGALMLSWRAVYGDYSPPTQVKEGGETEYMCDDE